MSNSHHAMFAASRLNRKVADGSLGLCKPGRAPARVCAQLWRPPALATAAPARTPADAREALPKLWDEAKTVWNAMWLAFGNVVHTIAGDHIQPATHKLMGDWVRNAELLVRRIILIASLTLELAPLKPVRPLSSSRRSQPAKAHAPKPVTLDDPETWKTSFRFFPRAARYRGRVVELSSV